RNREGIVYLPTVGPPDQLGNLIYISAPVLDGEATGDRRVVTGQSIAANHTRNPADALRMHENELIRIFRRRSIGQFLNHRVVSGAQCRQYSASVGHRSAVAQRPTLASNNRVSTRKHSHSGALQAAALPVE